MTTSGKLNLSFGVHRAPKDAPRKVLMLVESPEQALRVSIKAAKLKLAYLAAVTGLSEGYLSRLANGKRKIPADLVPILCAATGSNLLRQVCDSIDDAKADEMRIAELLRAAA